jgi:hypothetical protein
LASYSTVLPEKGTAPSPDNSPDSKELGGTGFPACAKNTLLFRVIKFAAIF